MDVRSVQSDSFIDSKVAISLSRVNTVFEDDKSIDGSISLADMDIRTKITEHLERLAIENGSMTHQELANLVISEIELQDQDLINFTTIEAVNVLNRASYALIPKQDRMLLIPHCLRDAERCIAPIDDDGYHCQKCGACVISDITTSAEAQGMKWYMVGGGSHAIRIVMSKRPRAVFGIACYHDAKLGLERVTEYNIPAQGVLLSKDGCVNTEVDLERVLAKLGIDDSTDV